MPGQARNLSHRRATIHPDEMPMQESEVGKRVEFGVGRKRASAEAEGSCK